MGVTLLEGDEIAALPALGGVLTPLIDSLRDVVDTEYLASAHWDEITRLAGLGLAATVRVGEYWDA